MAKKCSVQDGAEQVSNEKKAFDGRGDTEHI